MILLIYYNIIYNCNDLDMIWLSKLDMILLSDYTII